MAPHRDPTPGTGRGRAPLPAARARRRAALAAPPRPFSCLCDSSARPTSFCERQNRTTAKPQQGPRFRPTDGSGAQEPPACGRTRRAPGTTRVPSALRLGRQGRCARSAGGPGRWVRAGLRLGGAERLRHGQRPVSQRRRLCRRPVPRLGQLSAGAGTCCRASRVWGAGSELLCAHPALRVQELHGK